MSQKLLTRVTRERAALQKDAELLLKDGIYVSWSEQDCRQICAMAVGPEGTPYEGGLYFFTVELSDEYPFKPPKATIETRDGVTRIHPNLYENGKICLSILGTWQGDPWHPTMKVVDVVRTTQSLLQNHPIRCEPGFETESGKRFYK